MLSYPSGTFIPIAIATHGLVGLALGRLFFDRPIAGLVAGVVPDADFLLPAALEFPFVHRGITHTMLLFVVAVGVFAVIADRDTVGSIAAGYGSHLLIDVTTPKGIPVLYPLLTERLHLDPGIAGHAPIVTLVLWLCCLGGLAVHQDLVPRRAVADWR